MIYDFDRIIDRSRSDSIKWQAYDDDVLPLWVADMDFVSPEPVLRALQGRVAHGIFGYPESAGHSFRRPTPLHEVLLARLERLYSWQVDWEALVFIPGVVTGFDLACHALAAPGGQALIQPPVYMPFLSAPGYAGLQRQDNPLLLQADGSYAIDWAGFEAALTPQTRLFILCNPHNPVGRVFRPDELSRMAELCLQKGVTICSDEIHCDLVFSGQRHTPIAALDPEIAQHSITLMAPSKTFNIAGLACSFAIIPNAELRKQYVAAHRGLVGWVNVLGWTAALAAYQDGQEWLEQLLAYLEANRNYLYETANHELPGVRMGKPEGTYLAWLDCREAALPTTPYQFLLQHARVALNNGAAFGPGGEGFVRLNFGCPRATLVEAVGRMKQALAQRI
jgi:cystathionine beta-lyase